MGHFQNSTPGMQVKNAGRAWEVTDLEWNTIPDEIISKLFESIPQRLSCCSCEERWPCKMLNLLNPVFPFHIELYMSFIYIKIVLFLSMYCMHYDIGFM